MSICTYRQRKCIYTRIYIYAGEERGKVGEVLCRVRRRSEEVTILGHDSISGTFNSEGGERSAGEAAGARDVGPGTARATAAAGSGGGRGRGVGVESRII